MSTPDVQETLRERGERYGDFADHARIAQGLRRVLHTAPKWATLPDMHKQALEAITDKIARVLNGDPNYPDNFHDIAGYARLVEERLSNVEASASLEGNCSAPLWTVWVVPASGAAGGTTHVAHYAAPSHTLAGFQAIQEVAEAWNVPAGGLRVLGAAAGIVNIVDWTDEL